MFNDCESAEENIKYYTVLLRGHTGITEGIINLSIKEKDFMFIMVIPSVHLPCCTCISEEEIFLRLKAFSVYGHICST